MPEGRGEIRVHYVRRAILVLLILMLVLTAVPVTFVALNIPVDLRVLKRPLINAASSQLGLDVTIDGDMQLVPGLEPTLTMGGLAITDPRNARDGNRITVGLARVQLALVPLLYGEIRIEELTGEDIHAVAIVDPETREETASAPDSSSTPSTTDAHEPAPPDSDSTLVFKGLENLGLRRISVDVRSAGTGKSYRLVLNELTGAATADRPLSIDADGTYQDEPFRLQMSGDTIDKILLLKWSWPLEMNAEIAGMQLQLAPAAAGRQDASSSTIDYSLTITGNRFDELDRVAGVSLPPLGPYSIGGRFAVSGDSYGISDFALRVGNSDLQGSFDLDLTGDIPTMTIDLTADALHLADFDVGDWSPTDGDREPETKSIAGTASAEDAVRSMVPLFDTDLLKRFTVQLSLAVRKVESSTRELGAGSARVRLQGGVITLDPLRMELPQGPLEFSMVLDPASAPETPALALLPLSASATVADTTFRFDRVDGGQSPRADGKPILRYRVGAEGENLASFDSFAGVSLPPVGPYALSTLVTVRDTRLALRELDIRVGDSDLTGDMFLDISGERPRTEMRFATEVLQLNDFIFEDWSMVDPATEAPKDEKQAEHAVDREQVNALLSRDAMTLIDAVFALDVASVRLGEEALGSGSLAVTLEDGRLDVKPVQLNIPGGALDMSLAIAPAENDMFASVRAEIDRFDYGVLARRTKPDTDMGGHISLDTSIESRADKPEDLMRNANGHMLFGIWPDAIEADVFELWTVNLLLAIMPTVDEGPRSKVNCVVAGLEFHDGVATQTALFMDTTNMQVGGTVKADFKTEAIEVYVAPQAKEAQFFSAATPVQVDGSFADFGIGAAPGALLGTVVRILTSVVTVPVQRMFQEKVPEDGETACAVAYQGGIPEGR
jgi:uncharacterized protein involved in outer membrane biogenesis